MDPFLNNARQFFQGLPKSTRGYDGSSLEDTTHAPPTPTPPATPTLPPAHAYYPYQLGGSLVGAAPATSLPGQLPQSRPITPATPSHKPLDHTPAASPYVSSFLQPPSSKPSANDSRYLDHVRQVSVAPSSRSLNPLADARTPSRSYSSQPSLVMDSYTSQPYSVQSTVPHDSLHTPRSYSTQAPSTLESHLRPYGLQVAGKAEARYLGRHFSQLASTNDTRTHTHPFSPPSLVPDPRTHHLDNKYASKADMRPDLRGLEIRPDPRPDHRLEHQWPPVCRAAEAKALERLAPSVHITTAPNTVNGSKDALYLGRRPEESSSARHGDDPYRKTLQVNGSRDPLYANGSHTTYPAPTQRQPSSERVSELHPKEDSALDLSVKTVRQTPDSTAPDPEKSSGGSGSSSTSPLNYVNSDRLSHNDSTKCSSSSIPSTGSGKVSKGPSPVPKATHGLGGPLRPAPASHVPSPYGINGSPSLMSHASPIARVPHMLSATKRPGDPSYPENRTKVRRSASPGSRAVAAAVAAHQPPSAHYPAHLSDKMMYSSHKEAEQSRGLSLLAGASLATREVAERRQLTAEQRDAAAEWRKDPSAFERRVVREAMVGRSDPSQERREASLERKGAGLEKWARNPAYESGYPPAKPSEPFDPYRAWLNSSEQAGPNGERSKYSLGQSHTATSVPSTLPQQGSRVPPTQHPHSYSAYGRPPDRLPHTPYSQAAPLAQISTPHQQAGMMPPSQSKLHQPYSSSRVPHSSSRNTNSNSNSIGSNSSSSSHPVSTTTVTQLYTSTYPHPSQSAHHQHKQDHHRSSSQYSPLSYPHSAKGAATMGFPAPHQTYPYTHHRPDSNHSLYPPKRTSQVSPHPASSPHPSVSPHPSASPHLSASPHPSASPHLSGSPHPLAASPRPGVSPHPSQQGRTPQSSPHPAQRLPTSSPAQLPSHSYPNSHPPSPYSTHQTTPPSITAPPSHLAHQTHQSKSPGAHVPQPPSHPAPAQPHSSRPQPVNPPSASISQYPDYPPQDHLPQTHPLSYPSHLPHGYTSPYLHHIQSATSAHTRAAHSSQPYPASQSHPPSQLHQPYSSSQSHPSTQPHPSSQMHPPSSQHHSVSQSHPPSSQHHPPSSQPHPPSSQPHPPSSQPHPPSQAHPPSQPHPPTSYSHSSSSESHPPSQGHSSSSQPPPTSQLPSSTSQAHSHPPTSDAHTPTSQSYPYSHTHRVTPSAPDTSQTTPHSTPSLHSTTSYSQASQTSHSTLHSTYASSYSQANSHSSSTPSHTPHSQSYAPHSSSYSTPTPVHSSQPSPSHSTHSPSSTNSSLPPSSTPSSCPPPSSSHTSQVSPSTQSQSSHSTQSLTSTHSTPSSTSYSPLSTPVTTYANLSSSTTTVSYPPSSAHSQHPSTPTHPPTHPPSHPPAAHSSQPPSSYVSPSASRSSQPHSSTHSTQPSPSASAHIPPHSSHTPVTTAASSHPSHIPPHATTAHSSYTPPAARVPSHITQPHHPPSALHLTHSQSSAHPSYPPHPSQAPTQAPPHPSHPSQAAPHPSHHPHSSYTPAPHPSHPLHYAQGYHHPSHPYPYLTQGHPHPSLTHSTPPTTQASQTSPRSTPAPPHPPAHHLHPSHPYPQHSQSYYPPQAYGHSSQGQAHAPASHYPRGHTQPAPQQARSHSSPSIPPQVRPTTPAQPSHPLYPSQSPSVPHTPQPGHRPSPHPPQTHSAQAPPHHPHYQATRLPHPAVKMENVPGASQYMGYMYPSTQYCPPRPDAAPGKGYPNHTAPQLPSSGPRVSQEGDVSRVYTKGEQKSYDSPSSGMVKPDPWPAHPSTAPPTDTKEGVAENSTQLLAHPAPPVRPEVHKTSTVFEFKEEDNNQLEQPQSSSKVLEPGKAALAEKLHKKIHRVESLENLAAKKEGSQESSQPKKEVKPEENEWDSGFDKLLDDLASNPDTVTSKKSKTLGRRYLQKVQIQEAIDNDLIALPTSYAVEEEEEDSEPEPPVKFRGKFKSIKDKKVERLILTYASHSDESATEMIPDEDASDFEEELKREIRSKDKRRGQHKKSSKNYESSGSEVAPKSSSSKKSSGRGQNKENKPNNKQDLEFSYSTSNSSSSSSNSSSDSSSSDSNDDSDSDNSDSDEEPRPKRTKNRRGKKWDSESTDSEVIIPRRRTRGGYKSSSDDEEVRKPSQKNKKRRKKQDSSDSDDVPLKMRRGKRKKKLDSDEDDEYVAPKRGKKKGTGRKKQKKRIQDDSDEASEEEEEEEVPKKTRARKKNAVVAKKSRSKRLVSESSSSDSEEEGSVRRTKKVTGKRKKGSRKKQKKNDDSSDNSDIPTTKKSHSKTNIIVESDNSDDSKKSESEEKKESEKSSSKEKSDEDSSSSEKIQKDKKVKSDEEEEEREEEEVAIKINEKKQQEEEEEEEKEKKEDLEEEKEEENEDDLSNDSVVEKLNKMRAEELNREDVREMKAWFNEVTSDMKKQLGGMKEVALRHCWKKPQFGAGEDFLHGWQTDVKKYKELSGRFPKKLCQAAKHQAAQSPSKGSSKKNRDQESGKDSPQKQGQSSPAKNTRSKSGIIKTSMAVVDDERLKVAARPEISSVMQRFFDKVLAETGNDCTKGGLPGKKFNLGPFSGFGAQRVPTGLTPTPSVAPSMMASDDSDLDSLASLRMDLPASDSIPVSRRSIASSLLKKFGRKYNDKRLSALYLNKPRSILAATNKPQLLPTPGMPTTEQDLKGMSPDELKMATFFRRETVNNYRDNFEVIVTKNGMNEFIPILYQSRTRNKTKQIQDAATLKSVFGTDIPPHLLKKVEEIKTKKQLKKAQKKEEAKAVTKEDGSPVAGSRASTPAGSLMAPGEEDDDSELRSERSGSVLGESSAPQAIKRARRKFRKFRSGFDYIRKKKKVKVDDEATPSRKRIPVRRHVNWPEESRDVAAEVRSWVVNKGLGETVLHKAARLQYHDVVVYCAESPDFDINVRDNAGYTPLHEACNRGHLDIAQVMCAHGAHVNAPGYKGMRPLHEAVENGHGELARLLLAYGADPALTTYAGQTCLALCADTQTLELMEGYLADLKGWPGNMWHFTGPARLFDPEEQGCDVFSNIPDGKFKVRESSSCLKKIQALENPSKNSCVVKIEDVTQDITEENTQRSMEKLNAEKGRTIEGGDVPCITENSSKVLESIKKEVMTEDHVEGENGEKEESQKEELERRKTQGVKEEESEESEIEEMTFMCSEEPIVDIYEVEGRPHRYCLLREVTRQLGLSRRDLIVAAKTIETLTVSPEEFESRVYSCVFGTSRWQPDGNRVELIRLTAALEHLLGLETVSV